MQNEVKNHMGVLLDWRERKGKKRKENDGKLKLKRRKYRKWVG